MLPGNSVEKCVSMNRNGFLAINFMREARDASKHPVTCGSL